MRSIHATFVLLCTALIAVTPGFGAPAADDLLASALARMDETAGTFKGLKADMK